MATFHITLIPSEPIGVVSPRLHGHFVEHLGELVYPALWVGEQDRIRHYDGWRADAVDALKELGIPVLRWPGGNFADSYRWRDGIGPRDKRPLRLNTQWGNVPEPNEVGTHEFIRLCRLLDAEPYFAGNLGSEAPGQLKDWVEYCNFGGRSAIADERRANGAAQPFAVGMWGVGNENWGAGGNMGPEHYAAEYCRYRTYVHEYSGTKPWCIASGPNSGDWDWTRRFFQHLAGNHWDKLANLDAFALHHYAWSHAPALPFDEAGWLELLASAAGMESLVRGHRQLMDRFDPSRRIALIVDEWGSWHHATPGRGALHQQNTVRDAHIAALTLDILTNRCDIVAMANLAQIANVLHSVLLVEGDAVVRTPTWHAFALHRRHRRATAIRCDVAADVISEGGARAESLRKHAIDRQLTRLRRVHAAASVQAGTLHLTLGNAHPSEPCEVAVRVTSGRLSNPQGSRLDFAALTDHNTAEARDRVGIVSHPVAVDGDLVRVSLPPGSIAAVSARLG